MKIPAKQAKNEFDDLLSSASSGKEVVIVGADGSTFKLVALSHSPKPIFGSTERLTDVEAGDVSGKELLEDARAVRKRIWQERYEATFHKISDN